MVIENNNRHKVGWATRIVLVAPNTTNLVYPIPRTFARIARHFIWLWFFDGAAAVLPIAHFVLRIARIEVTVGILTICAILVDPSAARANEDVNPACALIVHIVGYWMVVWPRRRTHTSTRDFDNFI